MSRRDKKPGAAKPSRPEPPARRPTAEAPEPKDVIDGVPDRSANRRPWKYAALALVFLAWVAFLVACGIMGAM